MAQTQLQRSSDLYTWYANQLHNPYYPSPPQSYTLSSAYNTFHQPPFNYSHFLPPDVVSPTPLTFFPSSQPATYYSQQYQHQHQHPQYIHQHNSYELQRLSTWKNDDKNWTHQVFDKMPDDKLFQPFKEDDQISATDVLETAITTETECSIQSTDDSVSVQPTLISNSRQPCIGDTNLENSPIKAENDACQELISQVHLENFEFQRVDEGIRISQEQFGDMRNPFSRGKSSPSDSASPLPRAYPSTSPASSSAVTGPPRSIRLVYCEEKGKFRMDPEAVATLQLVKEPIGVVSVCGRARQGKSFILNQVLGRNNGFQVSSTHKSCTKGLWLWSSPIKRTALDGTEYNLLLLDSEGIDAYDQTGTYNTQIFSLVFLLSSMFVYNQMGGIDEALLDRLSLVTQMTKHIRVKASGGTSSRSELGQFSPIFVWHLRDFYDLVEYNRKITPRDYLEIALRQVQGSGGDIGAKNETRLQLLSNVSGVFSTGVLTALVGSRGAGKTTLMAVLADRKTGGYIKGDTRISGYPKEQQTFARISGYVEQNDIPSPQVTVEESLWFSASLRLPKEISKEQKKDVEEEEAKAYENLFLKYYMVKQLWNEKDERIDEAELEELEGDEEPVEMKEEYEINYRHEENAWEIVMDQSRKVKEVQINENMGSRKAIPSSVDDIQNDNLVNYPEIHMVFSNFSQKDVVTPVASKTSPIGEHENDRTVVFGMMQEANIKEKPAEFTLISLLKGCSNIGLIHGRKQIQDFLVQNGFHCPSYAAITCSLISFLTSKQLLENITGLEMFGFPSLHIIELVEALNSKHHLDKILDLSIAISSVFGSSIEDGLLNIWGGDMISKKSYRAAKSLAGLFFQCVGHSYVNWAAKMVVGLNNGVPWVMCKEDDTPDPIINAYNGFYCDYFIPKTPYKPTMWTEAWSCWLTINDDVVGDVNKQDQVTGGAKSKEENKMILEDK